MDAKQMINRVGHASGRKFARLVGYRLAFNKQARDKYGIEKPSEGKTNVVPDSSEVVEGALYDINHSDLSVLDSYEVGYHRKLKPVEIAGGRMENAWVYIADNDEIRAGLRPTKKYLGHLLGGKDILSAQYYQRLASTPTLD